jgi:hypothetical protein
MAPPRWDHGVVAHLLQTAETKPDHMLALALIAGAAQAPLLDWALMRA